MEDVVDEIDSMHPGTELRSQLKLFLRRSKLASSALFTDVLATSQS